MCAITCGVKVMGGLWGKTVCLLMIIVFFCAIDPSSAMEATTRRTASKPRFLQLRNLTKAQQESVVTIEFNFKNIDRNNRTAVNIARQEIRRQLLERLNRGKFTPISQTFSSRTSSIVTTSTTTASTSTATISSTPATPTAPTTTTTTTTTTTPSPTTTSSTITTTPTTIAATTSASTTTTTVAPTTTAPTTTATTPSASTIATTVAPTTTAPTTTATTTSAPTITTTVTPTTIPTTTTFATSTPTAPATTTAVPAATTTAAAAVVIHEKRKRRKRRSSGRKKDIMTEDDFPFVDDYSERNENGSLIISNLIDKEEFGDLDPSKVVIDLNKPDELGVALQRPAASIFKGIPNELSSLEVSRLGLNFWLPILLSSNALLLVFIVIVNRCWRSRNKKIIEAVNKDQFLC